MEDLGSAISKIVDDWVEDLIKKIMSSSSSGPQRGLWDRIKGGMYNLFYGRTGERAKKYNPYYSINRFGDDLGSEVKEHLTLSDYVKIKDAVLETENKAEEMLVLEAGAPGSNLRLFGLLKNAANELKQKLIPLLSGYSKNPEAEAEEEESSPGSPPEASGSRPASSSPPPAAPAPPKPAPPKPAPPKPAPAKPAPAKPKPPATPAPPDLPESPDLESIYKGKETGEEIFDALNKALIQKISKTLGSKNARSRLQRKWQAYKENSPHNIEELKEAIKNGLINQIISWGFDGIDNEDSIKKLISDES